MTEQNSNFSIITGKTWEVLQALRCSEEKAESFQEKVRNTKNWGEKWNQIPLFGSLRRCMSIIANLWVIDNFTKDLGMHERDRLFMETEEKVNLARRMLTQQIKNR